MTKGGVPKVKSDRLLLEDISNLESCFKHSFSYKFNNDEVGIIYDNVKIILAYVNVHNDNGLEFIRNRYYHFFGYDSLIDRYDDTYRAWIHLVSEFSYNIFDFILENYRKSNSDRSKMLDEMTRIFLKQYNMLDRKLKGIHQRALIQLKKIDEIIYYRSVFD